MTLLELKQKLNSRALASLHNPDEITAAALDAACHETIEEIKNKKVKEWAIMDFAYIRLKIYLKIDLLDDDLTLYREARKEITGSPNDNSIKYSHSVTRERLSDWY